MTTPMPTMLAPRPAPRATFTLGLLAALGLLALTLAFTWPTTSARAHQLPVSIAGPADAVQTLTSELADQLDLRPSPDQSAVASSVQQRHTLAGIAAQPDGSIDIYTASAAHPPSAVAVERLVRAAHPTAAVTVHELAPLATTDPQGAALAGLTFPLALGGILGGILILFRTLGLGRRFLALGTLSLGAGVLVTVVLGPALGVLHGNPALLIAAITLAVGAPATLLVGAATLVGRPGLAAVAVTTMLLGNPLSGAGAPWQTLLAPWGALGQALTPGASTTLLRSLSYFPEASTVIPWVTLSAWTALGAGLLVVGTRRRIAARRAAINASAAAAATGQCSSSAAPASSLTSCQSCVPSFPTTPSGAA